MKWTAVLLAFLASAMLLIAPVGVSAEECPSVAGVAKYNFEDGVGRANLRYDGEQMFVPITAVSFNLNYPFVIRVTSWDFPDGAVEMTETYELMPVGPNFRFDSAVTITSGGSGALTWSVNSIPRVGLNIIRQIAGDVCVDA